MPDAYGRFSLGDGLVIAKTFQGMHERRQDDLQRQQIEGYLARQTRGEKITTDEPGYNYANHMAAQGIILRNAQADEQYRAYKRQNDEAQAGANQKKVNEQISQARVFYYKSQQAQDPAERQDLENRSYDALLPVYEYVPDGGRNVRFKDQLRATLLLEDSTGAQIERQAPPLDRALSAAEVFSGDYRQAYLENREKIRAFNADQLIKATTDPARRQMTADGREALFIPFADVDEKGNFQVRKTWQDPQTGKVLKGFDPETGKDVQSKLDFRSMQYWNSVKSLAKEERDVWESSVEAAEKAWATNLKEDAIPEGTDENTWKQEYSVAYYRRLKPNAPLPKGVGSSAGGGPAGDHWENYVNNMVGGDGMMASHGPGRGTDGGPVPARGGSGAPAARGIVPADQPAGLDSGVLPTKGESDTAAPRGIVSAASASAVRAGKGKQPAPVRDFLPADVSSWEVQVISQNGKPVPFIMLPGDNGRKQATELTPDEYLHWQQYARAKTADAAGTARKVMSKIPRGTQPLIDRSGIFNR